MKPRCTWTGHLKLSLVTIPVRVYNAINTTEKITFNQLHKGCQQRIRQKLVCPSPYLPGKRSAHWLKIKTARVTPMTASPVYD